MTAFAVALLSAATLAFQILLVRVFGIEQFHHFAAMAIGVAMLGYGASGTLMALVRPSAETANRWFPWTAALVSFSLLVMPLLANRADFDPTQLPWQLAQWARLALMYVLLAVPFGLTALAVLLALIADPTQPGRIYGASFVGSGLGAAGALAVLAVVEPAHALAAPVALAAAGGLAAGDEGERSRLRPIVAGVGLILAVVVVLHPPWQLDILPFKPLPQTEAFPGAERVAEDPSPTGWVVAVEAPAFRFAPGLSLAYQGAFPRQSALFVDGDLAGAATRWTSATSDMLDWLPAGLPYAVAAPQRVLVVTGAAGMDVPAALKHGADVTAVELHPALVRLVDESGVSASDSGAVRWVVGDARAYVARTNERYGLIVLGPTGGLGGAAAGVQSLSEDFLRTVEAYEAYLAHLTPSGMLAVTSWLTLPPRGEVRAILTAVEALRRRDPAAVPQALMVLRGWGTVTTLVKPAGFTAADVAALEAWGASRWFDVDWRPGLSAPATRYNFLDGDPLFEAAHAATTSSDAARRFASTYPLRVTPATDARPYPHHFLGIAAVGRILRHGIGSWLPFAEWGPLVLLATAVQAIVVAALLTLLPAIIGTRGAPTRTMRPVFGYFGAIGFGYLAAEVAAIQQLELLLGHPVYAVAAVLTVLLLCSGLGSALSDRLHPAVATRATLTIAALLVAAALLLLPAVHWFQSSPLAVRVLVSAIALTPLALAMGMPFPLGLRALAKDDVHRTAWAWATNGFASVVAAPVGAIICLELGSSVLLALAGGAYLGAWVVVRRRWVKG